MSRTRVVLVAMYVAYDDVPHAGGRYLLQLQRFLADETELTVLSVRSRTNEEAAAQPGAPDGLLLLGHERGLGPVGRVLNRLALVVDARWRRRDPGAPPVPFLLGLARSRAAREAIRRADVVDLQWSESVRLVRLVRRMNPDARIVGTFHDVMSQSFTRRAEASPQDGRRWERATRRSERQERSMVGRLDRVLVFSDKDAALLRNPPHAAVVPPPLATGRERRHEPGRDGVVLVVSYLARKENDTAAHWVLDHVWPLVRRRHPSAVLRLVGGGARQELVDRVAASGATDGVQLAGFVRDLAAEYRDATVCLVALHQGAGVKFKTVEALLHGVPVVTTGVGAEGISGPDLWARCTDDPVELAAAVDGVLADPRSSQAAADRAQEWALTQYGVAAFEESIRATWHDVPQVGG